MSEHPVLPFTGERYTPERGREIAYEHWHRYALARPLAAGRRVLDAACGEGYGSALQARIASRSPFLDFVFGRQLPDGSQQTALVPKVYLMPRPGDLAPIFSECFF